ncbi:hypothetical protein LIA77_00879 [Sarocladium implicatum]|nr:hypothetical protein LIA77_00879 [Sarocladium implicatum]
MCSQDHGPLVPGVLAVLRRAFQVRADSPPACTDLDLNMAFCRMETRSLRSRFPFCPFYSAHKALCLSLVCAVTCHRTYPPSRVASRAASLPPSASTCHHLRRIPYVDSSPLRSLHHLTALLALESPPARTSTTQRACRSPSPLGLQLPLLTSRTFLPSLASPSLATPSFRPRGDVFPGHSYGHVWKYRRRRLRRQGRRELIVHPTCAFDASPPPSVYAPPLCNGHAGSRFCRLRCSHGKLCR